jgi:hypothetical protein
VDTLSAYLPEAVAAGPEFETLRGLTAGVQALERSVLMLRSRKAAIPEKDYWQQMEPLLIGLARTTRRLKSHRAALETWHWAMSLGPYPLLF